MKKPVLVVMAAGLGSRYGSLKQIDPVGPGGEIIIDYSLYDAAKAGFEKAVFIIKEEIEKDFKEIISHSLPLSMEAEYVFQTPDLLPPGYKVPRGRTKPWGTAHAVMCAGVRVGDNPFVVINADDYYGADAFKVIFDYMTRPHKADKEDFCMVAYQLGNTLTENGYVSRGICVTDRDGTLVSVTERTNIIEAGPGFAKFTDEEGQRKLLKDTTLVSMNLWGFTPAFMRGAWDGFPSFLDKALEENPLGAEYYLPRVVTDMIEKGIARVQVLSSKDKWYGVTYREDRDKVKRALRELHRKEVYPPTLLR